MNGRNIVSQFSENPSETNLINLVNWANSGNATNDEIALLAQRLADSGSRLEKNELKADIPSTGGPSSLSTILCPLMLAQFGFIVPKLGVPGRPAGGIDVLAQIPGFKTAFNKDEIIDLISHFPYVHFLADENFAPLDKLLFSYRAKTGNTNVIPLVIASILSKKIACGVTTVGLDIRVSNHGNFGTNFSEAELNALRFIKVSKLLGIKSVCFLSESEHALQPYIGRGESLIAIHKIINRQLDAEHQLKGHFDYCLLMSQSLKDEVKEFSFESFVESFRLHLELQGATMDAFNRKVGELLSQDRVRILASRSGYFHYSLQELRDVTTSLQAKVSSPSKIFSDPCGARLLKIFGQYVHEGEPLAEVRYDSGHFSENDVQNLFSKAFATLPILTAGDKFKIIGHGR